LDLGVERNVVEALSTAGVSAERIVELILSEDKEQREGIIRGTGLSKNYIMKLQRRALRTSAHLQLPSPLAHSFRSGLVLHVLFDSHDRALFIKKELCRLLNMKGTTFSYWKKKAGVRRLPLTPPPLPHHTRDRSRRKALTVRVRACVRAVQVSDIDTSQDFRLMDKCRSIFGGRSTYTLYSAEQMLTILQCMQVRARTRHAHDTHDTRHDTTLPHCATKADVHVSPFIPGGATTAFAAEELLHQRAGTDGPHCQLPPPRPPPAPAAPPLPLLDPAPAPPRTRRPTPPR
jgi:hypothetical protein